MARGPLPKPDKRRANKDTIPTTKLPVGGKKGRPPKVPDAYNLQKAGKAWWKWAWGLPQAHAWDKGTLYFAARRAALEDDLAALQLGDRFEIDDYLTLSEDEREAGERIEFVVHKLKALASGSASIMKEMRELENRLGLNPKALADLRWEIVPDEEPTAAKRTAAPSAGGSRRARLSVVA